MLPDNPHRGPPAPGLGVPTPAPDTPALSDRAVLPEPRKRASVQNLVARESGRGGGPCQHPVCAAGAVKRRHDLLVHALPIASGPWAPSLRPSPSLLPEPLPAPIPDSTNKPTVPWIMLLLPSPKSRRGCTRDLRKPFLGGASLACPPLLAPEGVDLHRILRRSSSPALQLLRPRRGGRGWPARNHGAPARGRGPQEPSWPVLVPSRAVPDAPQLIFDGVYQHKTGRGGGWQRIFAAGARAPSILSGRDPSVDHFLSGLVHPGVPALAASPGWGPARNAPCPAPQCPCSKRLQPARRNESVHTTSERQGDERFRQ